MTATPQLTPAERERLLAAGGALRASLARVKAAKLGKRLTEELWAWAADLRMVRGLAANTTIARYLDALRDFLLWVKREGKDDRALVLKDFDQWQRELYTVQQYSVAWRTMRVTAVRQFYAWRAHQGHGQDLAHGVRGPKRVRNMPRRYTEEQVQRLFAATPADEAEPILLRDRAILAFLLATGARREECALLDGAQLELRERVGVVRFRGKGAKEREVSFEGEAVQLLHRWLSLRSQLASTEDTRVWISLSNASRGRPITVRAIEDAVKRAARRARLRDSSVHRFRVTFATELYDAGVGIREIQRVLGHESVETTEHYIQVSNRQRSVRLSGSRQHRLMGTKPQHVPLWLQQKLGGSARDA